LMKRPICSWSKPKCWDQLFRLLKGRALSRIPSKTEGGLRPGPSTRRPHFGVFCSISMVFCFGQKAFCPMIYYIYPCKPSVLLRSFSLKIACEYTSLEISPLASFSMSLSSRSDVSTTFGSVFRCVTEGFG